MQYWLIFRKHNVIVVSHQNPRFKKSLIELLALGIATNVKALTRGFAELDQKRGMLSLIHEIMGDIGEICNEIIYRGGVFGAC